jgi:hypothetical protein
MWPEMDEGNCMITEQLHNLYAGYCYCDEIKKDEMDGTNCTESK